MVVGENEALRGELSRALDRNAAAAAAAEGSALASADATVKMLREEVDLLRQVWMWVFGGACALHNACVLF